MGKRASRPPDVELAAVASPHTARLAEAVKALVEASAAADPSHVEEALNAVEHRIVDIEPRRGVPFVEMVAVFQRDSWTCRYCGNQTVAPPVLRVLSHMYPDRFPYHPNWKAGQVHPAYLLLSTSLDHVQPGGRGGSWSERENLVAACWPCNSGKADFTLEELGWEVFGEAEAQTEWDGLTSSYAALWHAAGQPDTQYHRRGCAPSATRPAPRSSRRPRPLAETCTQLRTRDGGARFIVTGYGENELEEILRVVESTDSVTGS